MTTKALKIPVPPAGSPLAIAQNALSNYVKKYGNQLAGFNKAIMKGRKIPFKSNADRDALTEALIKQGYNMNGHTLVPGYIEPPPNYFVGNVPPDSDTAKFENGAGVFWLDISGIPVLKYLANTGGLTDTWEDAKHLSLVPFNLSVDRPIAIDLQTGKVIGVLAKTKKIVETKEKVTLASFSSQLKKMTKSL